MNGLDGAIRNAEILLSGHPDVLREDTALNVGAIIAELEAVIGHNPVLGKACVDDETRSTCLSLAARLRAQFVEPETDH